MKKNPQNRIEFEVEEVEDNELVDVMGGTGCGGGCDRCTGCSAGDIPGDQSMLS